MKPYILVVYYSKTGNTAALAKNIADGVVSNGMEVKLRQLPTLTTSIADKNLEPIPDSGPLYASLEDLENCSGVIIGSPTRFGIMAAEVKYYLDQTSKLWFQGNLINKPAAFFTSTGSIHGGQEATLLSSMIPLLHHGAIIVGIPYSESALSATKSGGTPYGASNIANNNLISEEEKILALALGKRVAQIAEKLQS